MAKKIRIGQIGDIAATRLLGRYSASTGSMQEITLGTNLALTTAGVLNATNSTYSNMSLSELTAGTVTSARTISAKTLNDWINSKGFITSAPNTVTRLRGSTSGTYVSGDVSIVAGANTTVTQSGQTITIASENAIYSAMTLAELQAGTVTTNRVISAKVLSDWLNAKGYVTTDTTYTAGTNIQISASNVISATNSTYSLASDAELASTTSTTARLISGQRLNAWATTKGFVTTNTTYSVFTRTVAGLVPAPGGTTTTRFLREDGTWVVPTDTNTTYSTMSAAELTTGTVTTGRLISAKVLTDWINGKGFVTTDTNTTYSAGAGLTLSGTTFSLPVTVSGTGTYVQSVVQNTNGITVTLGTPPNTNTTYALMTQAAIDAGTETTGRLISAKLLADNFFKKPTGTTAQYIRGDGSLATYANTTYSAGTLAQLQTGTDTSNRVWSAKILADYVQANSGGSSYTLPIASSSAIGGIRIGTGTANLRGYSIDQVLGALTMTTASTTKRGIMQVGAGLTVNNGVVSVASGGGGSNYDIVTNPAFEGEGIQHSAVYLESSGTHPAPLGYMDQIAYELEQSYHKAVGEMWTYETCYSKVDEGQICGFYSAQGSSGGVGILGGGVSDKQAWYYNHQYTNNNWVSLVTYNQTSAGSLGGALPTTKLGFCTSRYEGDKGTILFRGWAHVSGFEHDYNDGRIFLFVAAVRNGVTGSINQHEVKAMSQNAGADFVCIGVLRHPQVAYINMDGLFGLLHGS